MTTGLIIGALLVLITGIGEFAKEYRLLSKVRQAESNGDCERAFEGYNRLVLTGPLFFDEQDLEGGREAAAVRCLREAVARQKFAEAIPWIAIVENKPDTGLEPQASAIAATLARDHLMWTRRLLQDRRFDDALREAQLMRRLYLDQQILAEARVLEGQIQLTQLRHLAEQGEVHGLLERVAALDHDTPFPVRAEAETLAIEAIRREADRYMSRKDYPSLLRFATWAVQTAQSQPFLWKVEEVRNSSLQRLFNLKGDLSPNGVPDPPPLTANGRSTGRPTLTIKNENGRPRTVLLKGREEYSISINGNERGHQLSLSPREYVQLVRGSGRTLGLGVIHIKDNQAYVQHLS